MKKIIGVLMAVSVQAAEYSVGASSVDGQNQATVPVSITPDSGGENVSGYIIQIKYDPTKVEPVTKGTDSLNNVIYAEADPGFGEDADAVFVSGVIENTAYNQNTLIVAWASAKPVPVQEKTNMAEVTFQADDNATGSVDLAVTVVQATKDGETVEQNVQAANGEIDIASFLRGDANGNGEVELSDANMIIQSLIGKAQIEPENMDKADANGKDGIELSDANLVIQSLIGKATIPN